MNKLYFGDSLDILKELHKKHGKGFIDLVYIDPPFNSKRNYNVLFEEFHMKDVKAQKEAFADTWSNIHYKDTLHELQDIDLDLYNFLKVLDVVNISKSAVSYLTTMAIRIWYIHKVLNETGSFYLHCDPTMSHYLKVVCDLIFGEKNFRNEITWQRTNAHSDAKNKFSDVNDVILYYGKSSKTVFFPQYTTHNEEYVKKFYRFNDNDGRGSYQLADMASPNPRHLMMYEWQGFPFPAKGWRFQKDTMQKLHDEKRIYYPKYADGSLDLTKRPRLKRYLLEQNGTMIGNNWTDIFPLQAHDQERLGYPTQKPIALLERIIQASSNEGNLVADFFCGCGTTVAAAQKMNRNWIGGDISHLAIGLIEKRLRDTYGTKIIETYNIEGFPKDIGSAKQLAAGTVGGRLKFQDWIIEAKLGGVCNPKKTADGGWDGHLTFEMPDHKENVLIEVKSGNVNVKNLREFIHVVEKTGASIGVFVCFKDQLTKPMLESAKDEGYFLPEIFNTRYNKIQLITVEDILEGKNVELPLSIKTTFKTAKKAESKDGEQGKLF